MTAAYKDNQEISSGAKCVVKEESSKTEKLDCAENAIIHIWFKATVN